jgi:hypothetical protein
VLCTARQQDQDAFQLLVDLLRSREPKLLDILPPELLAGKTFAPAGDAEVKPPFLVCAEIPLLPDLLSAPGVPPIFSSA